MIIAEEIKQLRAILGITQKELAEKIGTSIKTIANYEAGAVIPMAKQRLLHSLIVNARNNTSIVNACKEGGDNINNSRNVHNAGKISVEVPAGDNSAPKYDKDQQILILENEVKHLNMLLAEKERFIQVLLKK